MGRLWSAWLWLGLVFAGMPLCQAALDQEALSHYVIPPMELGPKDTKFPVWQVLNSGGALAGYIFESQELTSIPGFSGTPMNFLVTIDTSGGFIDVKVLDQNEPVFVSGLGSRPFHEFVYQYRGKSLASNIKVLPANAKKPSAAESGANTYIDGVTKATASVRIANETILAATLKIAREKLANIAPKPTRRPRQGFYQSMGWPQLVASGLLKRIHLRNSDVQKAFADTAFSDDDSEATDAPNELYLDLWVADLGIPSVARNILPPETLSTLQGQLKPTEEPLLVLANGRHQLVADGFVRNSVPDRMAVQQDGFPISLRDADADIDFLSSVPDFEHAMILRIDTRYGFDPSSPWEFIVKSLRKHGSFQPTVGSQDFTLTHALADKYFEPLKAPVKALPIWAAPWIDNQSDILILILFLAILSYFLHDHRRVLTRPQNLAPMRFVTLAITLFFVGWYEQGQLSIVTILGVIRALFQTQNFAFLLYDPISLVLWVYVLITLVIWGRGTFCGWLCPFGALQEFAHQLGRKVGLKEMKISPLTAHKLGWIKYFVLAGIVASVFAPATISDKMVEVEPFKTAITLTFERSGPFVLYAIICILASILVFKSYCRFLCPLGAALALGGKIRQLNWLVRRSECGTPCKLCQVTCQYEAIVRDDGSIKYDDCFQCFECVEIYDDSNRCVPLLQESKRRNVEITPLHQTT